MNIDNKALMRKYNLNILLGGGFIILYVFWQFLSFYMDLLFNGKSLSENLDMAGLDEIHGLAVVVIVLFSFLVLIFFSLHIYVGVMAIRFAKGKNKKSRYLIASFFLLFLSIFEAALNFKNIIDDTVLASFILDATLCFIIADLIYSTIRYKKLKKLQEKA